MGEQLAQGCTAGEQRGWDSSTLTLDPRDPQTPAPWSDFREEGLPSIHLSLESEEERHLSSGPS